MERPVGFFGRSCRLFRVFVTNFANVLAVGAFHSRLFRERGTTGQSKAHDQEHGQGFSDSLHTFFGAGLVRIEK